MADEIVDQVAETVNTDQVPAEQSEETKVEPITADRAYELAQGLQKGYTQTRQDIAEIRANQNQILETINANKPKENEEEYLTVGKLREILSEQSSKAEAKTVQADNYVDTTLAQLRVEGVVKSEADEQELLKYAIDKKEPDLTKAADRWVEVRQAREEAKKEVSKEVAKKETRQEEGSKVGTSSKGSEGSKGVNYNLIHNTDWSQL